MSSPDADSANLTPTPGQFDSWYSAMAASPRRDALVQQHLGLPPDLFTTSALGWDGVEDVTRALLLETDQLLLDLACGRGGYGLEVARRCGARVLGVDSSSEAVKLATRNAEGSDVPATFRRGAMESTGLDDASVDAILCVDAIQLSTTPLSAYAEMRRVLRPGGRVVLTTWVPLDPEDQSLALRLRQVNPQLGLSAAGFGNVDVQDRPGWLAQEQSLWQAALELDAGDDQGLLDLRAEAEVALPRTEHLQRVIASAVA